MSVVLRLEGFRSHHSTKVTLPAGLTTYVCGPNGSGKTDLYRAIRWVLFAKKNDKIHPLDTSTVVRVSLRIAGMRVVRTGLPDTILVQRDGRTYQGEDAETIIRSVFGTREAWELSSSSRGIHPYITANSQKRLEILNEITEEAKARDIIVTLVAKFKSEVKVLKAKHEKEMIRYEAVYGSESIDSTKILSDQERAALQPQIVQAKRVANAYQTHCDNRSQLEIKAKEARASVAGVTGVTASELERLREQESLSRAYTAAEKTVQTLRPTGHAGKRATQEELDAAIVAEANYAASHTAFSKLGLSHIESSVTAAITACERSLEYSEIGLSNAHYRELERACPKTYATVQDATLAVQTTSAQITALEQSIKYTHAFQQQKTLSSHLSQLGSDASGDLISLCTTLEHRISQQKVHASRAAYEREYTRVMGEPAVDGAEAGVLARIQSTRSSIDNIERSKVVVCCPHCSGQLVHVDGKLAKFEGKIEQGDTAALKRHLSDLTKLATMKYPALPDCEPLSSVSEAEAKVALAKRCIALRSSQVQIPEGVAELDCTVEQANARLGRARQQLGEAKECVRVLTLLEQATKPREIPLDVEIMDEKVCRERLRQLSLLQFHPKPTVTATAIRAQLRLQEAQDKLAGLQKPERLVSESEVREYASRLSQLEVFSKQLEQAEEGLAKITTTKEMLLTAKKAVRELEVKLADDKKYSAMDKQAAEIEVICDELDARTVQYDRALEYLEQHFKPGSDVKMKDCSQGLANDVNSILSQCDSCIRIDIPMKGDRTKIVCFKNGKKLGSPLEASDGEVSLMSFAFRLCFCLMRRGTIVILDEVTREMSALVRDMCLEIAMNACKKAGKTLLITDHTSICGDYDKVIDLTPGAVTGVDVEKERE